MSNVKTIVIGTEKLVELTDEQKIDLLEQTFMSMALELKLSPEQIKEFLSGTLTKIEAIEEPATGFVDLLDKFIPGIKKEGNKNEHKN